MIGNLNSDTLEAVLETIPIEFSVVDEYDKVIAWNKHENRISKRPEAALGRNVRDCHPKKSLSKVEQILSEMKEGKRDVATFWIDLKVDEDIRKILIRYFALRDKRKNYIGCLEVTQDITDIQKITGEKRLMD